MCGARLTAAMPVGLGRRLRFLIAQFRQTCTQRELDFYPEVQVALVALETCVHDHFPLGSRSQAARGHLAGPSWMVGQGLHQEAQTQAPLGSASEAPGRAEAPGHVSRQEQEHWPQYHSRVSRQGSSVLAFDMRSLICRLLARPRGRGCGRVFEDHHYPNPRCLRRGLARYAGSWLYV